MEIRLEVDDEESLRQLYMWLRDDDIRRSVPVRLTPTAPVPGQMGGALEVINALVSNGIALGGLLMAIVAWRESRPRAPRVRIERDGTVVELTGSSPEEIRRVVEALAPEEPGRSEEPGSSQEPGPSQEPSPSQEPAPAPTTRPAPTSEQGPEPGPGGRV